MKKILIKGKILIFLGMPLMVFAQTQQEKISISQHLNSNQLQSMLQNQKRNEAFQRSEVKKWIQKGYKEFIEDDNGTFSQLIGTNELGFPIYLQTMNQNVVSTLGANVLQLGFDEFQLTGSGMTIGLWEPSSPRLLHEILRENTSNSRIVYANGQASGVSRHASHTAGTLIGNQTNLNSTRQNEVRGVAYQAKIKAYDWNFAASEMATEALNGLLVANMSFGYAPAPLNEVEYGRYSVTSQEWDAVMCAAPYLQIVKPVGNVRNNSPYIVPQVVAKGGFDLLESSGTSKNVLVVSAVDLTKDIPSETNPIYDIDLIEVPYSSWGPTDDGRIKPDITAHGHNVQSSIESSNTAYGVLSGTSMATAGVSGAITLLQQYYKEKFGYLMDQSEVPYLWSSSIRALIVHTADEIGHPGPDYQYGWGVMNAVSAAKVIQERGKSTIIREEKLSDQSEFKLNVVSNGYEPLVVTLAWTDPEGEVDLDNLPEVDDASHKLVNDLDVRLIRLDSNGSPRELMNIQGDNLLFPWKRLEGITNDVNQLSARSIRGVNNVDNIEKIEIPVDFLSEKGGLFQIIITHKGVLEDNCTGEGQNFSLVVSGVSFCEDEIVLYQHQDDVLTDNEVNLHVKADTIIASNVLEPVLNSSSEEYLVEYDAASFIELVPQGNSGFTAAYGSDFLAHINCSLEVVQAFSSRELTAMKGNLMPDASLHKENSVIVYPNPVIHNFLNIQFDLEEPKTVEVLLYDLHGQLIQKIDAKNYESGLHKQVLDLTTTPKGIYVVKVLTNSKSFTQKIIKK